MQQDDTDIDPWALEGLQQNPTADNETQLSIDMIDNVVPLDDQFGVNPRKTVPDALYEPLFGQPEPTVAELEAAGGDPDHVPPMQTYAILDAAKVFALAGTLESSGLEHRCLFKGEAYDELKDVAPWVVRLKEGHEFTRHLFTSGEAPWLLWDKEPGIYVRSRGSLDDMWRHFRKFTQVQDESGKWYYFRFWEAANISTIEQRIHDSESPFISVWSNVLIASAVVIYSGYTKLIKPVGPLYISKKSLQMKQADYDAIKMSRQNQFINKVSTILIEEHPKLYSQYDLSVIRPLYFSAQKKGYTIELASYNYIRSGLLAQKIGLNIEDVEHSVDPSKSLSTLTRSKEVWEYLKKLGRVKK